jgi:[acyl-carrier-protein] S-malonyltransferase
MSDKAAVFAGQGAQFVGMGKDLAEAYPECRDLFVKADDVLGFSLSKICFEGPVEALTKSNNCQPAIFVTSIACFRALAREVPGLAFGAAAGLSLGEWSALHMAGALSFEDTLRVLEARGRFMQEACEEREGGMVSVMGLPADKLREIAAAAGVEIANLNSPEQTVLSGEKSRIPEVEKLASAAGAKRAIVLNVAGAFHSRLMQSAAKRLEDFLKTIPFSTPAVPVVANVTGAVHGGPDEMRQCMVRQVTSPVQWVACVQGLQQMGIKGYAECGPGKVLSGLIKRIDRAAGLWDVQDASTLKKTVDALKK